MDRKILISPGFGAGWSTWMGDREEAEFALFYKPLLEALEGDRGFFDVALEAFKHDYKAKFGKEPYCGGADTLRIETVSGPFRVEEYDGSESLRFRDDDGEWF